MRVLIVVLAVIASTAISGTAFAQEANSALTRLAALTQTQTPRNATPLPARQQMACNSAYAECRSAPCCSGLVCADTAGNGQYYCHPR
jgi:hypothetical protein